MIGTTGDKMKKIDRATTTYAMGILQSRVYRILKKRMAKVLVRHKITSLDWAVLGTLSEHVKGMKLNELATVLSVEPPLITRQINALEKLGLVKRSVGKADLRAKSTTVTAKGKRIILAVEPELKKSMRALLEGISPQDLLGYYRVLSAIAATDKNEQS